MSVHQTADRFYFVVPPPKIDALERGKTNKLNGDIVLEGNQDV